MTYGWLVLMSGDFSAMAKVLCTAQSTAGKKPCRGGNWEKESAAAFKESSFLQCHPVVSKWTLRDMESTQALIDEASLIRTVGARKVKMAAAGRLVGQVRTFSHQPFECVGAGHVHTRGLRASGRWAGVH